MPLATHLRPLALLLPLLCAPLHASELPNMGDSSASLLSQAQEEAIGRNAYQRMQSAGSLVDDLQLQGYLAQLGQQITAHLPLGGGHYTFFLVDDPTINAFAMPGGYIGVHTGLLIAAQSEDELASVLAHEVAHVHQHHLARQYEQASRLNLPLAAAIIAAILASGSNAQVGQAAIFGSLAGASQMELNFSRAHEAEADRVGITLLSASGHDPLAMAGFFRRLHDEERYRGAPPAFLSTHPVTLERLAEAQQRAEELPRPSDAPANPTFDLVKAKLVASMSKDPQALLETLRQRGGDNPADRYAQALLLQRQGETHRALTLLRALHEADKGRLSYLISLAEVEADAGEAVRAAQRLDAALALHPTYVPLVTARAELALRQGEAEAAARLLRGYLSLSSNPPPRLFGQLARAEDGRGHPLDAALAEVDLRLAQGQWGEARQLLERLEREQKASRGEYYLPLIQARLEQLERDQAREKEMGIE